MKGSRTFPCLGGILAVCFAVGAQAQRATATLVPTAGNSVKGTVTFTQKGDKLAVDAKLSGLAPGEHSFHIHNNGDCSAPDAMTAGANFNPTNTPHGAPGTPDHHASGDMPTLRADASGNAALTAYVAGLTIGGGLTDIVGRSVIVHNKPLVAHKDSDDSNSRAAGDSGARVACGVIGAARRDGSG